ncbi:hypothetical protein PENTCL1PPCAC_30279, partial [Pristionchus entomophagus]
IRISTMFSGYDSDGDKSIISSFSSVVRAARDVEDRDAADRDQNVDLANGDVVWETVSDDDNDESLRTIPTVQIGIDDIAQVADAVNSMLDGVVDSECRRTGRISSEMHVALNAALVESRRVKRELVEMPEQPTEWNGVNGLNDFFEIVGTEDMLLNSEFGALSDRLHALHDGARVNRNTRIPQANPDLDEDWSFVLNALFSPIAHIAKQKPSASTPKY